MPKVSSVKGMPDIMPPDSARWQVVEGAARSVFASYGYSEIRTPIVERLELFRRGVGEATALVEKEMYSFTDQGGDDLALRPEGTASVVRAYIESGAHVSEPIARYYYMGPMFRRERPQRGRQRQFYQIGSELLGVEGPLADAEVIAMVAQFLAEAGVSGFDLAINSIGCGECRPPFNGVLLKFLKGQGSELCEDCARRIERNPLRALDCKKEGCREILKGAPRMRDHWCSACRGHFGEVKGALDALSVRYREDGSIVRGLDYYMRTAFEFTHQGLGAQDAIVGGGRYDGLVKALGGPDVPGVGFALGMERLLSLIAPDGSAARGDAIFFAAVGERARGKALPIIQALRRDGVRVEWDYATRSLKGQMRQAQRVGAQSVVILGDEEVASGEAIVRDMRAGTQQRVRVEDLPMHFVEIGG